ncbi:MAG: dCTP deaminase [Oscillospiraceae bacterium]|nr:dCTP deaminase [Oscillospiraceae bacterium]
MLTGNEIRVRREFGELMIEPFDARCINPNSYDVHLAGELLEYNEIILDAKSENRVRRITIPEEGIVLKPGKLYLGRTVEYTETDTLVPMYDGRSSCGRLGLFSHVTAGFGDLGFHGFWTLELTVVQPLRVYAGMRIGQICFFVPRGDIIQRYNGKYQGAADIIESRMCEDLY